MDLSSSENTSFVFVRLSKYHCLSVIGRHGTLPRLWGTCDPLRDSLAVTRRERNGARDETVVSAYHP